MATDTTSPRAPRMTDHPNLTRVQRAVIAGVAGLVGAGALFGGQALLRDPQGLGAETAWLEGSPFPDYTVPGMFLLVVIGGGMLATAVLALVDARVTGIAAFTMGVTLLAWGAIETLVVGYQGGPQLVLLGVFVLLPAAVLVPIGWRSLRRGS